MDIRTLPEDERNIYNTLREKYKLTFDKLKLGEDTVRLLKVTDLDPFLEGKNPFENLSDFPLWVKLWDAATILAYTLNGLPDAKGKRLLEVGAGLAAPGLGAAANGFDVTVTDYEDIILDFQRVSAAASGLTNITSTKLDWFNPPEMEPFDVVAGAEIVFRENDFEPILGVFEKYLKPGGTILLAHDAKRKSLKKFFELASKDYEIAGKVQKIKKDGEESTIIVNRLLRKK